VVYICTKGNISICFTQIPAVKNLHSTIKMQVQISLIENISKFDRWRSYKKDEYPEGVFFWLLRAGWLKVGWSFTLCLYREQDLQCVKQRWSEKSEGKKSSDDRGGQNESTPTSEWKKSCYVGVAGLSTTPNHLIIKPRYSTTLYFR